MRIRLYAAGLLALAALGQGGCATVGRITKGPVANPLVAPSADFDAVWKAAVVAVDEYFDIRSENRLARTIVTDPRLGATLLEPWYGDSVGFDQRLEATLQTIRRSAKVRVDPAPGGGWAVTVEVFKELEDLPKPASQLGGRAAFANDFPVNRTREIVGPVPVPLGWIYRGRDDRLEKAILARIRDALFL